MAESYLTDNEVELLNESALDRKTPFLIRGVSQSQFSIARHYGGITFNGSSYKYIPTSDELVRDDVVKWVAKIRKATKKKKPEATQ